MRFRLEISDGDPDGSYPVIARAPDGRTARGSLRLPWSPAELDRLLQRMADAVVLSSAAVRRDPTAYELVVQQVAGPLFEALPEGVRELLTRWLEQATRRTVVLLVRPPELARLPWEFLYDPAEDDYLFLTHSLIRHLPVRTVQRPLLAHRPLRILGIVGSAAHIDVDKERQQLEAAVAELERAGQVELEWVDHQAVNGRRRGSGWQELTQTIEFGQRQWHVVHFIGHGKWDGEEGEGALLLEGEPGSNQAYTMPASRLANRLRARPSIRLVVLNACHTGEPDSRDTFSSVAGALIRRGIPAAVGMQFPVTDPAAIAFSRSFYYGLAHSRSVQDAVTLARRDINDALRGSMEWGTPVLYVHDPDRPVFDVRPTGVRWSPKRIASIDAPHAVNAVAFSRDSGRLALACDRHEPLLVEAGQWLPPPAHRLRTSLYAAAFSPDGGWLATASLHEAVVVWDTGSGRPLPPPIRHPDWVPDVEVSPAGVLASACGDGVVRFWQVQLETAPAHRLLGKLPRHRDTVRAVSFDATGERLATACDDRIARIWRPDVLPGAGSIGPRHRTGVQATGSPDDQPPPPVELAHPAPVVGVAFSPNGRLLATACQDRLARIWDIDRGSPTHRFPHHGPVLGVAFSPDGRLLATASMDRTVRVWNLEVTGSKPVLTIEHARPVRRVAFSPEGQWLATASFDRTCQVWQFATEKRESA